MLIGLTGLKGTGKSTVASIIVTNHNFKEYSFAQPIKEALSVITGYSVERLDSQETKELPLTDLHNVTPRKLMTTLGTEWGRVLIHPELWTTILKNRILKSKNNLVVSDIRFENEADMIRKLGGTIIHVKEGSDIETEYLPKDEHGSIKRNLYLLLSKIPFVKNFTKHPSEFGVDVKAGDIVLYNDKKQFNRLSVELAIVIATITYAN